MGTVLHHGDWRVPMPAGLGFQSPSRWGRCCISARDVLALGAHRCFSPLLDGDGVASSDASVRDRGIRHGFQSPSRWGRCCIDRAVTCRASLVQVSVPFSMGTVLHRRGARSSAADCTRFSPLLDGDGVASAKSAVAFADGACFSPLLDGDGVASTLSTHAEALDSSVSVPFSMGTVLHPCSASGCHAWYYVSVPFSMGTVLHLARRADGCAVAVMFQSPSRWGRCCIARRVAGIPRSSHRFQSPSRWGRCCIV